jgi:voltage-gated potassium channel
MTTAERPHESVSYQIFMLVLSLFALRTIAVQVTLKRDPEVENILGYADYLICTIFFIDFLLSLWYGPNRWRYGSTWGWLDLRRFQCWGRLACIVRIFRVRRAANLLASAVLQHRSKNTSLAVSLLAVLLVIFSSMQCCSLRRLSSQTDLGRQMWTP